MCDVRVRAWHANANKRKKKKKKDVRGGCNIVSEAISKMQRNL